MATDLSQLMKDVLASPLGDVIASVGRGVAEAQAALDHASLQETLSIYSEGGDDLVRLMRDIGYRPTFYALPETTGEVNVSLRIGNSAAVSGGGGITPAPAGIAPIARLPIAGRAVAARTYVTPVDAGFANRYAYSAAASAKLTFKIVPVPPPSGLDDARIMPDLAGRTLADARTALESLDLTLSLPDATAAAPDSAVIASQSIAPGVLIGSGSTIAVTLAA